VRPLLFILGVFTAIVCIEKSAEANWCAHYNAAGGFTSCGFKTHHQCLAAVGLAGPVRQVRTTITIIEAAWRYCRNPPRRSGSRPGRFQHSLISRRQTSLVTT
jgi:hypothetical protein